MRSFRVQVLKVPPIVVCCLRLGHLVVRLRLACVDDIRELDGVLNEEYWDVVSNNVLQQCQNVSLNFTIHLYLTQLPSSV